MTEQTNDCSRTTLNRDTRERLWGFAAQVGLEITALDTSSEREEALDVFAGMLEREYQAGLLNKRFASQVVDAMRLSDEKRAEAKHLTTAILADWRTDHGIDGVV